MKILIFSFQKLRLVNLWKMKNFREMALFISFQDNDFILIICLQVTADGSINCANQPDEQESVVAQLCFCEAVTAINLLSQGGNFVFKMFTAFEHQMISLLYLFTCLFQEVHVIKPGKH